MTGRDRMHRLARWAAGPHGTMAFAVSLLFVLMSVSFLNIPWGLPAAKCGGGLCEVPVTEGTPAQPSIAETLFGGYPLLVVLIALVLAACMIGGVYLAKSEGGGPP
ncbi:MAG: hypothetical protein AABY30_02460 [Candidatus Thermoplasmatota archaeon]